MWNLPVNVECEVGFVLVHSVEVEFFSSQTHTDKRHVNVSMISCCID